MATTRRKVKCPGCGIFFYRDEEPNVMIKNRYWHKKCYEANESKMSQSAQAIQELDKYICELFKLEYVNARIRKQINDMVDKYHFTYSGIMGTLKYFYEIKQHPLDKANGGIGIVPYVYDEARKYYETIFYAQQLNKNIKADAFLVKERKIIIKSPRAEKKLKAIDLSFLEEGEANE